MPWLPPDLGFMNTITGVTFTVGMGLTVKTLCSLLYKLNNRECKTIEIYIYLLVYTNVTKS